MMKKVKIHFCDFTPLETEHYLHLKNCNYSVGHYFSFDSPHPNVKMYPPGDADTLGKDTELEASDITGFTLKASVESDDSESSLSIVYTGS